MKNRFNELLTALDMSNTEMAESLSLTKAAVSDILHGRVKKLSGPVVELLRIKHNVNPNWLITGVGEMFISSTEIEVGKPKDGQSTPISKDTAEYKELICDLLDESPDGLPALADLLLALKRNPDKKKVVWSVILDMAEDPGVSASLERFMAGKATAQEILDTIDALPDRFKNVAVAQLRLLKEAAGNAG